MKPAHIARTPAARLAHLSVSLLTFYTVLTAPAVASAMESYCELVVKVVAEEPSDVGTAFKAEVIESSLGCAAVGSEVVVRLRETLWFLSAGDEHRVALTISDGWDQPDQKRWTRVCPQSCATSAADPSIAGLVLGLIVVGRRR